MMFLPWASRCSLMQLEENTSRLLDLVSILESNGCTMVISFVSSLLGCGCQIGVSCELIVAHVRCFTIALGGLDRNLDLLTRRDEKFSLRCWAVSSSLKCFLASSSSTDVCCGSLRCALEEYPILLLCLLFLKPLSHFQFAKTLWSKTRTHHDMTRRLSSGHTLWGTQIRLNRHELRHRIQQSRLFFRLRILDST